MWDSPVAVVSRRAVTLARDWQKASPKDIVDSFYRPGQYENRMKAFPGPHTNDAWLSMSTAEFLPCIDRYGQFRHCDWPGKTKNDDDLRRAAEEEARDLAANPGPKDRDRFGGWNDGPRLEATGRFRTHKDERGKWWLVDPSGRLFWSFGPVRVSASSGMTPMNGDNSTPRTGVATSPRDCFFADLPPAPDAPDATPLSKFWTTHDDLLWPFFLARGETRVYDGSIIADGHPRHNSFCAHTCIPFANVLQFRAWRARIPRARCRRGAPSARRSVRGIRWYDIYTIV